MSNLPLDSALDSRPSEPFPVDATIDGKVCRPCGTVNAADANACVRCHKILAGNRLAVTTGIYAQHHPADLRERVDRFAADVVADLGGADELSTLERAYIGRLADVEMMLRLLAQDIAEKGLMTPAGSVRRSYEQLLAGVDRWDRLAQRLGMRRRPKAIASAQEIIAQHRDGGRA